MIHWWQGYVVVQIRGERLERLINRMMNKRLSAWNLRRISVEKARVSITVRDFFKLRTLLKETGCRVHIEDKKGLPFLFKRIKRRKGFYFGAAGFLAVLYICSSLIWSVEIDGVRLPEDEAKVRDTLAKLGVEPWSFKFRAEDPETIKREVAEAFPHVTWVGFEYKGTKARLKVVEKTLPELPEQTGPRHLVAKKKAIIYDLFVEQGRPMVKPNEYVKPGDVLVSGIIGAEDEERQELVSAKGKVLGEVWYETEFSVPLTRQQSVLTGEEKKEYYVHLGPFDLQVWGFGQVPFDHYIVREKEYTFSVKNWTFPVSWQSKRLEETRQEKRSLTAEEATRLGTELSRRRLLRHLDRDAEIKDEKILKKKEENGKVYMKMHYTVIEEIASEQLIFQQGD